ncbi:MAG TPA: hypothetical protein VGK73_04640 [Polyangiaceae bacterium]
MPLTAVLSVAIILSVPALLLLAIVLGPRRRRARLRRQTATGSATVVAMKATNTRVGHQPIMNVRMRLRFGESGKFRDIELKIAIHPLETDRIEVGVGFPIRFDPARTADYSIDFGGATGVVLGDLSA